MPSKVSKGDVNNPHTPDKIALPNPSSTALAHPPNWSVYPLKSKPEIGPGPQSIDPRVPDVPNESIAVPTAPEATPAKPGISPATSAATPRAVPCAGPSSGFSEERLPSQLSRALRNLTSSTL